MSLSFVRGEDAVAVAASLIGILALVVGPALAIDCTKAGKPVREADDGHRGHRPSCRDIEP
jgi:hypothetical protein